MHAVDADERPFEIEFFLQQMAKNCCRCRRRSAEAASRRGGISRDSAWHQPRAAEIS